MALRFDLPPSDEPDAGSDPADLALASGLRLWAGLRDASVTAERLAWLSLVAKALDLAQLFRVDPASTSKLGHAAGHRLVLELHAQVHEICRPLVRSGGKLDGDARADSRSRLRLYLVWCIRNESQLLSELGSRSTLEDLFEPATARRLIADLGEARTDYEQVYGQIPEDSDQELALDRTRFEAEVRSRRRDLEQVLEELGLSPLRDALARALTGEETRNATPTFPSTVRILDGGGSASARRQLREASLGFAYPAYSAASLRLHGSGLGLSIRLGMISPDLAERASTPASELVPLLNDILHRLAILESVLVDDA